MSSILKALKKLEQEKVRRGDRSVDLALDIHRGGGRRKGNSTRALLLLSVDVLLAVAVGFGLWWAGVRQGKRQVLAVQGPEAEPAPARIAEPAPARTAEPAPTRTAEPAPTRTAEPAPTRTAEPTPTRTAEPAESRKVGAPGSAQGEEAAPALVLTGIVWQQDAGSRMAIVNDLPVMVGTEIDGATVAEIRSDRVILVRKGRRLELLLKP